MRLVGYPAQCVAMSGRHSVRGPQSLNLPVSVLELLLHAAAARAAWAARGLGLRLLERGRPCAPEQLCRLVRLAPASPEVRRQHPLRLFDPLPPDANVGLSPLGAPGSQVVHPLRWLNFISRRNSRTDASAQMIPAPEGEASIM